jgi:hypothetical protein
MESCSITNELKLEIINQHQVQPSSGAFATVIGVKRYGNTAMHNIPIAI